MVEAKHLFRDKASTSTGPDMLVLTNMLLLTDTGLRDFSLWYSETGELLGEMLK